MNIYRNKIPLGKFQIGDRVQVLLSPYRFGSGDSPLRIISVQNLYNKQNIIAKDRYGNTVNATEDYFIHWNDYIKLLKENSKQLNIFRKCFWMCLKFFSKYRHEPNTIFTLYGKDYDEKYIV